jgi:hypothetical protein
MTGFVWFMAFALLLSDDVGFAVMCFGALAAHYWG